VLLGNALTLVMPRPGWAFEECRLELMGDSLRLTTRSAVVVHSLNALCSVESLDSCCLLLHLEVAGRELIGFPDADSRRRVLLTLRRHVPSPLDALPVELLSSILSKLDTQSWAAALLVCKMFCREGRRQRHARMLEHKVGR
jgi:hypothetical protein